MRFLLLGVGVEGLVSLCGQVLADFFVVWQVNAVFLAAVC